MLFCAHLGVYRQFSSREDGTISGQKKYFLEANGRQLALQEGDIIVGRSRNCNLVLKDPSASRNHALLIVHPDGVRLKDLNSTNGTYVNNQRLTDDVPLSPGDRISIGQTEMVFGASEEPLDSAAEVPAAVKPAKRHEETSDDRVPTALAPAAGDASSDSSSEALSEVDSVDVMSALTTEGARSGRSVTTSVLPRDSEEIESVAAPPIEPPAAPAAGTTDSQTDDGALSSETSGDAELLPSVDLDALDRELEASQNAGSAAAPIASASARAGVQANLQSSDAHRGVPETAMSSGGYRPDSVVVSSGAQNAVTGPRLEPAGFGIRLLAGLVDWLLLTALGLVLLYILGGPGSTGAATLTSFATSVLAVLMFLFGWSLWGTTPGKRLFKLYVREENGAPIGGGKAALRLLGYVASALALGLGFLMIAFTSGKRGLHDVIAGTYVGRA